MSARFLVLANEFATTLEGHYTTHRTGWLDYVLVIVSSISVLAALWYTIKYLLPGSKDSDPDIKYIVLDQEVDNDG